MNASGKTAVTEQMVDAAYRRAAEFSGANTTSIKNKSALRAVLEAALLTPPAQCEAYMGLPFRDRRKGGIWYCDHARKIVGNGKARPPCLCADALAALSREGEAS